MPAASVARTNGLRPTLGVSVTSVVEKVVARLAEVVSRSWVSAVTMTS